VHPGSLGPGQAARFFGRPAAEQTGRQIERVIDNNNYFDNLQLLHGYGVTCILKSRIGQKSPVRFGSGGGVAIPYAPC